MTDAIPAAAGKAALRRLASSRRMSVPGAGAMLAARVLRDIPPPRDAVVAGYWPMGTEMDVRPLLQALHARGHALCLPWTPPRGRPLEFRAWRPGDALVPGPMGTSHPADAAPLRPDWVLVPLLAFDHGGGRLGYGGGYYDRTLALLPGAFRLGVAFAAQEMPHIPPEPHDMPLHAIATERAIIRP